MIEWVILLALTAHQDIHHQFNIVAHHHAPASVTPSQVRSKALRLIVPVTSNPAFVFP